MDEQAVTPVPPPPAERPRIPVVAWREEAELARKHLMAAIEFAVKAKLEDDAERLTLALPWVSRAVKGGQR